MTTYFGTDLVSAEWSGSVACIGTFDGLHLGHRHLLAQARTYGSERGLPVTVVTFDRHPAATLRPEACPPAINTLDQNLKLIADCGVALTLVLPFDKRLAETSADVFFKSVLRESIRAEAVFVGHDFAFGKGREGDTAWLKERIDTHVIPPFSAHGGRVSSSEVRERIASGDVDHAAKLLDRPFCLHGVVASGNKIGRTIGFPTLNLARSSNQIVPANGVYAGRCQVKGQRYAAAINVGVRPTIAGQERRIEAHLLHYPGGDLYGEPMSLEFLQRVRGEKKFSGVDELKAQIGRDVEEIQVLFTNASEAEER